MVLRRKEGATYRLPTEAEWEYACRAGSTTRYSFGDDPEKLGTVGNVAEATAKQVVTGLGLALAARDDFAQTAPVGRYHPNAWGLFDMHGNVSEWCSDVYGVDYYKRSPVDDPRGEEGTALRVFRGGGWTANPRGAQSATRYGLAPDKTKSGLLGFRLARGRIVLSASKAGQEPATRP